MKRKTRNLILWLLTILPFIMTVIILQFMDDKIPMHYDINGNTDRWGSKYESFIFPAVIIGMTVFWNCFLHYFQKKQLVSKNEKEKTEAESNEKLMYAVAAGMAVVFGIMHICIMISAIIETKQGLTFAAIDINKAVNILMGLLIVVIGYLMPEAKPNSFVGLRTKWSMANEEVWAASNRFGGIVFVIAGILILAETILLGGIASTFIMLGLLIAAGILAAANSRRIYNRLKRTEQ